MTWTPCWVGVELDQFDEARDSLNVREELKLEPTEEQKAEFERLISQVPDPVRELLPPVGVHFVFCSS